MTRPALSLLAYSLIISPLAAQNGPGGVGSAANNVLWLSADNGLNTTGGLVNTWNDRSGNANHAAFPAGQPTARPALVTGSANGYPTIDFDGVNDQLVIPDHNSLDLQQWDIFLVGALDGTKNNNAWFSKGTSSTTPNYAMWSPNSGALQLPIRDIFGLTTSPITPAGVAGTAFGLNEYSCSVVLVFPVRNAYNLGTNVYSDVSVLQFAQTNTQPLRLGAVPGQAAWHLNGDIAEMIVFNAAVNSTQRIIINNYLAAKYGFTLTSNDIYVHDNPAVVEYDHDVAGIGRMSSSSMQTDSRGTGLVRINGATGLGNNEFLLWGHNNGPIGTWNSTDYPPSLEGRWHRVWRVSEVSSTGGAIDVGAVDMTFDLNGITPVVTNDIRLLVDTDNDGLFADETPIGPPTSLGGGQYRFPGVTALVNGRRFTLGTTNYDQNPLPVELVRFAAEAVGPEGVQLDWTTAAEKDNDHFTVERSADLEAWEPVTQVPGAGTSFSVRNYRTFDPAPLPGRSYYRLKQTDTDGSATWSSAEPVWFEGPVEAQMFPVPFSDRLHIVAEAAEAGDLQIFDAQGRRVAVPVVRSTGRLEVDGSALPPGTYVVRLLTGQGLVVRTVAKL